MLKVRKLNSLLNKYKKNLLNNKMKVKNKFNKNKISKNNKMKRFDIILFLIL